MLAMVSGLNAWAQEGNHKTFWDDPVNDPMLPVYLVTTFVFLVIILVAAVAVYLIRILNMLTSQAEKDRAQQLGITHVQKPGWWSRFVQQVNDAVPIEQEKDIELDHNYDGIRELDNHLPPWWTWLFIGTIVWAVIYIFVYHFSGGVAIAGGGVSA